MFGLPSLSPWFYGSIATLLIVTNIFTGFFFYDAGSDNVIVKWKERVIEETDKKIDTKRKQDVIQNAPIDVTVTSRRLREGTF